LSGDWSGGCTTADCGSTIYHGRIDPTTS
jgi:hypothetical protein